MSLRERLRALFREHHETCGYCCFYNLDENLCEDLVGQVAAIVAPEPASHCDATGQNQVSTNVQVAVPRPVEERHLRAGRLLAASLIELDEEAKEEVLAQFIANLEARAEAREKLKEAKSWATNFPGDLYVQYIAELERKLKELDE